MPRKQSNAELTAQLARQQGDGTLLLMGMNDAVEGTIKWYKTVKDSDGLSYRFGVSRLTGANGGLLFIRTSRAEQSPYTTVRYIDDEYAAMQHVHGGSEWHKVASEAVYFAVRLRNAALFPDPKPVSTSLQPEGGR